MGGSLVISNYLDFQPIVTRFYSQSRYWAGQLIDPTDFGPGGVLQDGHRVHFKYYDGTPFCNEYSLTFKTHDDATEFVTWYYKQKPFDIYDFDERS